MKRLSIVHINTQDIGGGAATVARRLVQTQREAGHDSKVIVGRRCSSDPFSCSFSAEPNQIRAELIQAKGLLDYEFQGSHQLLKHPWVQSADIIHLHNLHGGYFNPFTLLGLCQIKPVLWTLHDMQAMTGHCAHPKECERWKTGCGQCPDLEIYPSIKADATNQLWIDKSTIYKNADFRLVTPSDWLRQKVNHSILSGHDIDLIPNGVSCNIFRPHDRAELRRQLGLGEDVVIIGTVAQGGVFANPWKGGIHALKAFASLGSIMPKSVFLNIGSSTSSGFPNIIDIPYIDNEAGLARLLSALDIFLFSSIAENCPLAVLEAMACGLPVVAFSVGGIPELLRHGYDGYLVSPQDDEGLASSLIGMARDTQMRRQFGHSARKRIEKEFDLSVVTKKYQAAYEKCIESFLLNVTQPTRSKLCHVTVPSFIQTDQFAQMVSAVEKYCAEMPAENQPSKHTDLTVGCDSSGSEKRFTRKNHIGSSPTQANENSETKLNQSSQVTPPKHIEKVLPMQCSNVPLVSAIVSTHNSERFIRGCLEDLTSQTLFKKQQLEIIVIDSGSRQEEWIIVREFASKFGNIVYIRTDERESIYAAWNRGIKSAKGIYITNANTDDRHRHDALETMAAVLNCEPSVALVYGDVFVTNYENQPFSSFIRCGYHIRPDFSKEIMLSGCHMGPQPMWRRTLHDEIGYFDENFKAAGDYEFWCRIATRYEMRHIRSFLGLYFENPKGICNSAPSLTDQEALSVIQKYRASFPAPKKSFTRNYQYKGHVTETRFVNIGMVTFNRLEFTRKSIEALIAFTSFPHVVTVIDNGSTDGTRDYLTGLKRDGIIKNLVLLKENVGVAKASNLAWHLEPNADYYIKLDNDIVIEKAGWLDAMVATIDSIPEIGVLGYNFEQNSYPLIELHGTPVRIKSAGNIGGACAMIPRRTRERLGDWCEDYGLYGEEDGDYGLRARLAGLLNAYLPDENIGFHLPSGKAAVIDPISLVADDAGETATDAKYRLWKDEWRRKNQGGKCQENYQAYISGKKPLKAESEFVKSFNLQKDSYAAASENESSQPASPIHLGSNPLVSIIILTYNNLNLTRQCLNALFSTTDLRLSEVIVLDNASSDETPTYLQSIAENGRISLILNSENVGYARGCNQAAIKARGDLLIFLNNDTQPREGWCEAILQSHSSEVGVTGAKLLYPDGRVQHAGIEMVNGIPDHVFRFASPNSQEVQIRRELDMVTGACFAIKKELFVQLGGFDEAYKNGVEDVDLCLRVRMAGFKVVYEPKAVLLHYEGQSAGRFDHVRPNLQIFYQRWKSRFDARNRFSVPSTPEIIKSEKSILIEKNIRPAGATAFQFANIDQLLALAGDEMQKKNPSKAKHFLAQALNLSPGDSRIVASLGAISYEQNDFSSAQEYLARAAELDPKNVDILVQLALANLRLENISEFESALGRALELNPVSFDALKLLGDLNFQNNRLRDAAQVYSKILQSHPDNLDVLMALGVCFFKADDLEMAQTVFERILSKSPDHSLARENLEVIRKKRPTLSSAPIAEKKPATPPQNVERLISEADVEQRKGNLSHARRLLIQAEQVDSNHPAVLGLLGSVMFAEKDYAGAQRYFQRLALLKPKDATIQAQLALACLRLEQIEEFEAALGRALELDPYHREALKLLGDLNFQNGRLKDAAHAYTKILSREPKDVEVMLPLAVCFFKDGDLETAETVFRRVLEIDPTNAIAKENLDVIASKKPASNPPPLIPQPIFSSSPKPSAPTSPVNPEKPPVRQASTGFEAKIEADIFSKISIPELQKTRPAPKPLNPKVNKLVEEATFFQEVGNIGAALENLEEACELAPHDPGILDALGSLYFTQENFESARQRFRRLIELRPRDPSVYTRLAMTCLKLDRIEEMESALGLALEIDPNNRDALKFLAKTNLENNRLQDAGRIYSRLLEKDGRDMESLLGLGLCFFKAGDLSAARMVYERALEADPNNPTALDNLALLNEKEKTANPKTEKRNLVTSVDKTTIIKTHLAAAEQAFNIGNTSAVKNSLKEVLKLNPDAPDILAALGSLTFQSGEYLEAKTCFRKLVDQAPSDASRWVQLATVLHRLNDVEAFEQALGKALELDPNHIEGLRLLAYLNFNHGSITDAAHTYGKILRQTPNDVECLMALGVCFHKVGDYEAAKMMFERVLELEPQNATARENLQVANSKLNPLKPVDSKITPVDFSGLQIPPVPNLEPKPSEKRTVSELICEADAKLTSGDLKSALVLLQQANAMSPNDAEIAATLGSLFFQLGEFEKSFTPLKTAAELAPDSADFHTRFALAALMLERIPEFEAALGKALELDPNHRPALKLLADLNLRNEKYRDAAYTYNRLLRQTPDDTSIMVPLGVCFYKSGDLKAAHLLFERAAALNPNDEIAVANLELVKKKQAAEQEANTAAEPVQPTIEPKPVPPPTTKLSVVWEGSQFVHHSLALINRELCLSLLNRGHEVSIIPYEPDQFGVEADRRFNTLAQRVRARLSKTADVHIRHQWPLNPNPPKDGHWVIIQPWEFGAIPKDWLSILKQVDELWVPTNFVRECYIQSGIPAEKVVVVPNGIEPKKFHPDVQPAALQTRKKFKFLFVGGTIHRKGADVLLNAYLKSFTAADDVCLVIKDFGGKSFYQGQTIETKIRELQSNPGAPEILYLSQDMSPESIPGLYRACDCLVHPYRGEGFGLPVLEAMACGLPVVVTAGGAVDDFATDDIAYRIPAARKSLGGRVGEIVLAGDGWLLEPDLDALAEKLVWLVKNPEKARAVGRAASDHVRRVWTWEAAALKAEERLQLLAARKEKPVRFRNEGPIVLQPAAAAHIEVPAVGKLASLKRVHDLLQRKKYLKAWNAALEAISIRPFHPDAYLQMVDIALAADDERQALVCAERLIKMTPNWELARRVYASLKSQKNHRQSKIAWTPIPALSEKPQISVCLIAKNEEEFIERCLNSVKPFASQIVLVDTGSTDRTVEIAKRCGAEVHHFPWNDNFADARNAAHEHARGDWVLILDADEELPKESHEKLWQDVSASNVLGYRIPICNLHESSDSVTYVPRLFRNAPALFFVGRVHEQIYASIVARSSEWGMDATMGTAMIIHHGYDPGLVKRRQKVQRNLRLMEKAVQELPGEAALMMNYGLDLVNDGRLEEGLEKYRQAVRILEPHHPSAVLPEVRERLVTLFGVHLMKADRFEECLELMRSRLAQDSGPTASMDFMAAVALMKLNRSNEAIPYIKSCIEKKDLPTLTPACHELRKSAPFQMLAECQFKAGNNEQAEQYFKKALELEPNSPTAIHDFAFFLHKQERSFEAIQTLQGAIGLGINDERIWHLGSFIANSRPDFVEFAVDWTTEALKFWPANDAIRGLHAEALLKLGRAKEAFPFFKQAAQNGAVAAKAATILCQLVLGERLEPISPEEEKKVSLEFVSWYRRLLISGAKESVVQLNTKMKALNYSLPTAAKAIQQAIEEVE